MNTYCPSCGYVHISGTQFQPECGDCFSRGASGLPQVPKNGIWDWEGRIGRLTYFWIMLATVIIGGPVSMYLEFAARRPSGPDGVFWIVLIAIAPLSYIGVVAAIKRFHDLDKSGHFVFLTLIPLVNFVAGLYLLFAKGKQNVNEYGPPLNLPTEHPAPQATFHKTDSSGFSPSISQKPASIPASNVPEINRKVPSQNLTSSQPFQHSNLSESGMNNIEDQAYEIVAKELETNSVEKGLWTKAYAQTGGDEQQTKVLYIKLRVERLVKAEQEQIIQTQLEQKQANEARIAEEQRIARMTLKKKIDSGQINPDDITIKHGGKSSWFLDQCRDGKIDEVMRLVESSPDIVLVRDQNTRNTGLHYAVVEQHVKLVEFLLNVGCYREATNRYNMSALEMAKTRSSREIVDMLERKNG